MKNLRFPCHKMEAIFVQKLKKLQIVTKPLQRGNFSVFLTKPKEVFLGIKLYFPKHNGIFRQFHRGISV